MKLTHLLSLCSLFFTFSILTLAPYTFEFGNFELKYEFSEQTFSQLYSLLKEEQLTEF